MPDKPTYEELEQRIRELEKERKEKERLEAKQVKSAPRANEKLFSDFFRVNPVPTTLSEYDTGKLVLVNEAFAAFAGCDPEEAAGKTTLELNLWADPSERETFTKTLAEKGSVRNFEIKFLRKAGEVRRVLVFGEIIDYENQPHLLSMILDIASRKRFERALRESEKKFKTIFNHMGDAIAIHDLSGRFLEVNQELCDRLGFTREELLQLSPMDIDAPGSADLVSRRMEMLSKKERISFETEQTRADGETISTEVSARMIEFGGRPAVLSVGRDITERLHAEREKEELREKLTRSRKMDALGLLAGGVANDLNNILSGIVSYPELLLLDLPEDSKLRKPIRTIQTSGNRAVDVVSDLLTVARGSATSKKSLNLNHVVEELIRSKECLTLGRRHIGASLETRLSPDLLHVNGSRSHIHKALMNLVCNAMDAVAHQRRGVVSVSTSNIYLSLPLKGYDDVRIGEYVVLTVSDNGGGISEVDRERIFEPFYTKKVMGRSGAGLGLAVVWNTVKDHDGYIDVTTGEGGTTFSLYFPIARENGTWARPNGAGALQGSGEKILVVDDVDSQREIACNILKKLNYNVHAVAGGEEAAAYLKERPADLLVLDMTMDPGMGGVETYKRILEFRPGQKAIVASGFSEAEEIKAARDLGVGAYLKKPYTVEKIGLAIKRELERREN
ncbi:MAG: PAS domain S-box protein [Desulfobacterales bacterium]|nr:PAS domain S-box protein [Desulfobacterales bacterium]